MDIERQDKSDLERDREKFDEWMRDWDESNRKIDKIMALIAEISNSRNSDSTIAAPTPVAESTYNQSSSPQLQPFFANTILSKEKDTQQLGVVSVVYPAEVDVVVLRHQSSFPPATIYSLLPSPQLPSFQSVPRSICNHSSSSIILRLSSYSRSMCCASRCPHHHRLAPIPGVLTSPPRLAPVRPRPPSTALT